MILKNIVYFLIFFIASVLLLIINSKITMYYFFQSFVSACFFTLFFYFLDKKFKISYKVTAAFILFIFLLPLLFNLSTLNIIKDSYYQNRNSRLNKFVGENIPDDFFKHGWHQKEKYFCWAKKNAILSIKIDSQTKNADIYIESFPIIDKKGTPQTIVFKACDNTEIEYTSRKTFTGYLIKIHVPKNCIKNNNVDIFISSSYEVIPNEEWGSEDKRALAFGIGKMYIKENF